MVSLAGFKKDPIALEVYEACARRVAAEPRRDYLGMSQIGKLCERRLWLTVNGADRLPVDGCLARRFANGHNREEIIVNDLRLAGFKVDGQQNEYSDFDGRFRGHCDGVIHGVTNDPHILEIKTANDANFKAFVKHGAKHRPEYFAQMQCYMGYGRLGRSLFIVENKNNQELYTERVYFDEKVFESLKAKAGRILNATEPPAKCGDPAECKWCDFIGICDDPPEIKTKAQAAGPVGCTGCWCHRPASGSVDGLNTLVSVLRAIVNGLAEVPAAKAREAMRKQVYDLFKEGRLARPDVAATLTEFFCRNDNDLLARFTEILAYVVDSRRDWILYVPDESIGLPPVQRKYKGGPAKNDWCVHPAHRQKIFRPIGCEHYAKTEVPF